MTNSANIYGISYGSWRHTLFHPDKHIPQFLIHHVWVIVGMEEPQRTALQLRTTTNFTLDKDPAIIDIFFFHLYHK